MRYQIGEFVQMAQISVKQLKYYEQCGLIRPAKVDAITGYRYYEVGQLQDVAYVRAFMEMGFSTSEILQLIKEGKYEDAFLAKEKELKQALSLIQQKIDMLGFYHKIVKERKFNQPYCATVKYTPSGLAAVRRDTFSNADEILAGRNRFYEEIAKTGSVIATKQPVLTKFLEEEYKLKDFSVEMIIFLHSEGEKTDYFKYSKCAKTKAVSVVHHGAYDYLNEAYAFAYMWIEDNGYAPLGKAMESYYVGSDSTEDYSEYVTEIFIPII